MRESSTDPGKPVIEFIWFGGWRRALRSDWIGGSRMSQLLGIFLLSLTAMFNPSLLAALTVMLLMPNPKRLMIGYLLGAYLTSITAGLVIVFALNGSRVVSTSKHTISPLEDIAVGLILLAVAFALRTGRDEPFQERRRQRKYARGTARELAGKPTQSLPMRMLGKGDPRITFAVGAVLSFPGVSYLLALGKMAKLDPGTALTVLLVVGFCVIQQLFLEVPLLGYVFVPDRVQDGVTRFRNWMSRKGRTAAVLGASTIGVLLIARGLATLA